jgi:hypothetical protein
LICIPWMLLSSKKEKALSNSSSWLASITCSLYSKLKYIIHHNSNNTQYLYDNLPSLLPDLTYLHSNA